MDSNNILIIDNTKISMIEPSLRKFVASISILETYITLVSEKTLGKFNKSRDELTLEDLGYIYNTTTKNNKGLHGFSWELSIYNAIKFNDNHIQDLINTSINMLTGETSYERVKAILWGGEKKEINPENIKNILSDEDLIWTERGPLPFKQYIDMIYLAFNRSEFRKKLPQGLSGVWRADLFVKKTNSNMWFAVTVKFNRSDVKKFNGLSIGVHFEDFDKPARIERRLNPYMANKGFVYCEILFKFNLGEYFSYMFRIFKDIFENINAEIKNTHSLIFDTNEKKFFFKYFYDRKDIECSKIIKILKADFEDDTKLFKGNEILLSTEEQGTSLINCISDSVENENKIVLLPVGCYF